MSNIALCCADLHLKRRPDEQHALKQLVDIAIEETVEVFIAAGDLFDRQANRAEPVNAFHHQLDRLADAGIAFFFVQGNHDYDDPPWLSGHRHADYINGKIREVGSFNIYGLDFQPFGRLQEELKKIPEHVNFLVTHQTWSNWMGDIAAPQGSFEEVPAQIERLFNGDLHQMVIEKNKNAGGGQMLTASSGATAMQKVDEPSEHYGLLLTDKGKFVPRTIRSRAFFDWPVMTDVEELEEFVQTAAVKIAELTESASDLPKGMRKPLVRVTYSHRLHDAVRRIEKTVSDTAILNFKQLPPPERAEASRVRKEARKKGQAVTPLSVLGQRVNREEQPLVYEGAERLLRAENPSEEFRRWWAEKLAEE